MKYNKILLFFVSLSFLSIGFFALAQDSALPSPGITPDSSFYFLKNWKEGIQTFFTFGAENKAKQFLHLAEVRLAEYQKMTEKGKTEIAEKTLEKYKQRLNQALEKAEEAEEEGTDVEKLKEIISGKIVKHQEVLMEVLNKVPKETKKGIEDAIRAATDEKKIEEGKKETREEESVKITIKPKLASSPSMNTSLPWVTGMFQTEFPSIFLTGQPLMMRSPGSPMPQPVAEQRPTIQPVADDEWCAKKRMVVSEPTEQGRKTILEMLGVETVKVGAVDCRACHIRKFSENGILVAERWDDMYLWYLQKLSGKWACEKSVNYKNFMGEWVDYYQISESWSPQNFYYQCVKREGVYVSGNADYCEKDVPASAILPSPTVTSPTAVTGSVSCKKGIMEDYKCPNNSLIKWQCQCRYDESNGEELRNCTVNPAESCSLSADSPLPTINSIRTKYDTWQQGPAGTAKSISMQIFWETNKPTTSRIEYGLTTAYGSRVPSFAPSHDYKHGTYDLSGMQYNTTYHFRIIAEDVQGNKIVSDDYTFTTGL